MVKRVCFKPEFVGDILSGRKTGTARWKPLHLQVGDVVAAVTRNGNRPAFLVPASERFATLQITKTVPLTWGELSHEHLAKTTVSRDWYRRERPLARDRDAIYFYEWELVERLTEAARRA